jgi:hypothetical protein
MSNQDDFANQNDLDEFLARVEKLMDEFPSVSEADVQIMVPVDTASAQESFRIGANAAEGCNCPPGTRCVRLFPAGIRVCVPRKG